MNIADIVFSIQLIEFSNPIVCCDSLCCFVGGCCFLSGSFVPLSNLFEWIISPSIRIYALLTKKGACENTKSNWLYPCCNMKFRGCLKIEQYSNFLEKPELENWNFLFNIIFFSFNLFSVFQICIEFENILEVLHSFPS